MLVLVNVNRRVVLVVGFVGEDGRARVRIADLRRALGVGPTDALFLGV